MQKVFVNHAADTQPEVAADTSPGLVPLLNPGWPIQWLSHGPSRRPGPFQSVPLKGIPKAYRMLIGGMVTGPARTRPGPGPEITRGYILIISGV